MSRFEDLEAALRIGQDVHAARRAIEEARVVEDFHRGLREAAEARLAVALKEFPAHLRALADQIDATPEGQAVAAATAPDEPQ